MRIIGELYAHVGNSGATFQVVDKGHGPTIRIVTSAFGNLNHELLVHTNPDVLAKLGELFTNASQQSYSKEYCHAAYDPSTEQREQTFPSDSSKG